MYIQNTGVEERKESRRSQVTAGQGELRVLRASKNAAPTRSDHVTTGQSVHHTTDHIVPETEGLLGSR